MIINIITFGYKYGMPACCDLVFDVRFISNPYYVPGLKNLSGNNAAVKEYVMTKPETIEFMEKLTKLLDFLIPNYIKEGKELLSIGIGCTGGRHRSVAIANELQSWLKLSNYGAFIEHRDIEKDDSEALK
jgi:UPF0042 nucleotide-binding protein